MLKLDDEYKKPTVSERPFTFVFCALWALKQNLHHHNNGFPYWQGLSDPDFWVFVIQELHIPEVGGTKFTTFVLVNVAKLSHPVLFLFALSSFHWTGHHRGEQTQELRMYLWRKWAKWKGLSTKYYDYEQSVLQYIAKQQQCYDGQIESISCVWAEKGLSAFSNQVTSSLLLIGFVVRVERQGWGSF